MAAAKTLPLLEAGAQLVVVAPEAVDDLRAAARNGRVTWRQRRYEHGDLDGALLAIAATGDPQVDDDVARDAAARQLLCVRVDGKGTAAFPGVVRRGPLIMSVSTSGLAPTLSRWLRQRLEDEYGPEWGELAMLLGTLRAAPEVQAKLAGMNSAERRRWWRAALDALLEEEGMTPTPVDHTAALRRLGCASDMSISSGCEPFS